MMRLPNGHAISAVPLNIVQDAWPVVRGWINEALEAAWGYDENDVYLKLLRGDCLLWLIEKDMHVVAAVVTEISIYPRCKSLNIWLTGGAGFQEWKECLAALEGYGRQNQCEILEATGRPGLQKILKSLGFNVPRVMCAKKIDSVTH